MLHELIGEQGEWGLKVKVTYVLASLEINVELVCLMITEITTTDILQGRIQDLSPEGFQLLPWGRGGGGGRSKNYRNTIPFHIQSDVSHFYML